MAKAALITPQCLAVVCTASRISLFSSGWGLGKRQGWEWAQPGELNWAGMGNVSHPTMSCSAIKTGVEKEVGVAASKVRSCERLAGHRSAWEGAKFGLQLSVSVTCLISRFPAHVTS